MTVFVNAHAGSGQASETVRNALRDAGMDGTPVKCRIRPAALRLIAESPVP
jgi:hypothetical protein